MHYCITHSDKLKSREGDRLMDARSASERRLAAVYNGPVYAWQHLLGVKYL